MSRKVRDENMMYQRPPSETIKEEFYIKSIWKYFESMKHGMDGSNNELGWNTNMKSIADLGVHFEL